MQHDLLWNEHPHRTHLPRMLCEHHTTRWLAKPYKPWTPTPNMLALIIGICPMANNLHTPKSHVDGLIG